MSDWRPVTNALLDTKPGTRAELRFATGTVETVTFRQGRIGRAMIEAWWTDDGRFFGIISATHWRPLDASPS